MTINFPIDKVRDFLDKASVIVTEKNDLMPILRYIRIKIDFGVCIMTKTNNKGFCKFYFDLDAEDADFLIEESKLLLFCDTSTDDNFSITINNEGTIIYGVSYKQRTNAKSYDIDLFPKIPDEPKSSIRITKDIIDSFKIAKSCIAQDDIRPALNFAYCTDDVLFSSNAQILYIRKFNRTLPKIELTPEEITAISDLAWADFSIADNYNTYKNGNVIYGFIASNDAKPFDYKPFLNSIEKENYISIKIKDILNFCTSTIKFADSKFLDSDFIYEDGKASMIYQDKEKGENHELEFSIRVVGEPFNFRFYPTTWKDFMSALPYDEICIGETKQFLYFWNPADEGYVGIISKIM